MNRPSQLHQNVSHVIEHDLTDPRRDNMRSCLAALGKHSGEFLTIGQIATIGGLSAASIYSALRQLVLLSAYYKKQYGFEVEAKTENGMETHYKLTINRDQYIARQRALCTVPSHPKSKRLADADYRAVKRRLGVDITDYVPSKAEADSLFHNSIVPRLENGEIKYLYELYQLALRKRMLRTAHFKERMDIPDSNSRWGGNFVQSLENRAYEAGFVIASPIDNYQGLFFIPPLVRREFLEINIPKIIKRDHLFDHVIQFTKKRALECLNKMGEPGGRYPEIYRHIINENARKCFPKTADVVNELDVSTNQVANLRKKSKRERRNNRIYLRSRGDGGQQIVLLAPKA